MPTITSFRPQTKLTERKLKVIAENEESLEWNVIAIPDVEYGLAAVVHICQRLHESQLTVFERTETYLKIAFTRLVMDLQAFGDHIQNVETDVVPRVLILLAGIPQANKVVHEKRAALFLLFLPFFFFLALFLPLFFLLLLCCLWRRSCSLLAFLGLLAACNN